MKNKSALLLVFFLLLTSASMAQLRVNRKSQHINKFIVLKKLVKLSQSKSEQVAIAALNQIREVLFRSENLMLPETEPAVDHSVAYMVNRMNNDVDKIYEAFMNLEKVYQVANPNSSEDIDFLNTLREMIIEEIKLVLGSSYFQDCQQFNAELLETKARQLKAANPSDRQNKVFNNLQKLLDFSWYIYAEQSQWLMANAFRLECIDFRTLRSKHPYTILPELNITKPPRMFISQRPQDYLFD
ncbi:MAG: hypothetical protein PWR01_3577 [Clostridiales bacterium]|jgi:hypothetical protein|nr:hypothetical protein [Clostridiales bacterium]MDN5282504.1 hypothetical protein [Candidatus Ozemobacter sp.]